MASGLDGPARSRAAQRLKLRCELCDATLLSQKQLDQHLAGRRHKERLRDRDLSAEDRLLRAERTLRDLVLGDCESDAIRVDGRNLTAEIREVVQAKPRANAKTDIGRVLLYYKYTDVDDPNSARQWQLDLCSALQLHGRIHVATEGINGTVGGSRAATALYIAAMQHHKRWGVVFNGIDYKESEGDASVFPNLFVKSCDEIIALGCSTSEISWRDSAEHLEPAEFHEMLLKHSAQQATAGSTDARRNGCCEAESRQQEGDYAQAPTLSSAASLEGKLKPRGEGRQQEADTGPKTDIGTDMDKSNLVLLDCRNLYESEIGRFDGAIRCPTRHFTEFPAVADRMVKDMQLRDKTVLMYCTGGIRCERASAYLRSVGVRRCFQLKGGIARYCDMFPAVEPAIDKTTDPPSPSFVSGQDGPVSRASSAASEQAENEDSRTSSASSCKIVPSAKMLKGHSRSMFRGKNFVFDRRIALQAGRPDDIVGKCVLCGAGWDQYDRSIACEQCSALVLVCTTCRPRVGNASNQPTVRKKRKQAEKSVAGGISSTVDANTSGIDRLLCTYCRGICSDSQ